MSNGAADPVSHCPPEKEQYGGCDGHEAEKPEPPRFPEGAGDDVLDGLDVACWLTVDIEFFGF